VDSEIQTDPNIFNEYLATIVPNFRANKSKGDNGSNEDDGRKTKDAGTMCYMLDNE